MTSPPSLPRFDSICCGAVGSSPSHRPGCIFEGAAVIYNSPDARRARELVDEYTRPEGAVSPHELVMALVHLLSTISRVAIGMAP
jgi:hypothetical protein